MDLLELALQPSVLAMGQERARGQFIADLDKRRVLQMTSRHEREGIEREQFDERVRRGEKTPQGTTPRFRPSNPNQYMIDAIMRDAAIQQYDARVQAIKSQTTPDSPAWQRQAVLP